MKYAYEDPALKDVGFSGGTWFDCNDNGIQIYVTKGQPTNGKFLENEIYDKKIFRITISTCGEGIVEYTCFEDTPGFEKIIAVKPGEATANSILNFLMTQRVISFSDVMQSSFASGVKEGKLQKMSEIRKALGIK